MEQVITREWILNDVTYLTRHLRSEPEPGLPVLLMLHGFMGDGRAFAHLMEPLGKVCNPVAVDLLGHGRSEKAYDPGRYAEEIQLDDLQELVEQLTLGSGAHPLFLYGYSMGGRLALKLALRNPDMFSGLILESTHYGITDEEERKYRRRLDARRAQQIENDFGSFLSNWEELPLFESPLPGDQKRDQAYRDMQRSQDPRTLSASLRGFGAGEMSPVMEQLSQLETPLLFIAGSEDEKYVRIADTMTQLAPQAIKKIIPAGHRVHLDNPSVLLDEITNFIENQSLT